MFSARLARTLSTTAPVQKKVAVLGAAGGIGQPLALLLKVSLALSFFIIINFKLKCNQNVTGVSCYDVNPVTPGVGADLSHIDTKAAVTSFVGDDVEAAVAGCDIVLIPAGVPRKPG